jgi:chemotaxis protein MotB
MQTKSIFVSLLIGAGLLVSCGSSKKITSEQQMQIDELQSKNNQLTTDNSNLQKQLSDITAKNKTLEETYNSYKTSTDANMKTCEDQKKKLEAVQAVLNEESMNIDRLQKKLDSALADFESRGVEVYVKDGNIYVSMAENLLYKSGSAKLGDQGKKALGTLAAVLNDYPNLKIVVVGHTDNVQFKKGSDNWTLSTERANGVVRTLRDDFNVDPNRLTSAGKGKYDPVGDNSTAEGRAKNRRTDIVLNPDFDRIWHTIKSDQ